MQCPKWLFLQSPRGSYLPIRYYGPLKVTDPFATLGWKQKARWKFCQFFQWNLSFFYVAFYLRTPEMKNLDIFFIAQNCCFSVEKDREAFFRPFARGPAAAASLWNFERAKGKKKGNKKALEAQKRTQRTQRNWQSGKNDNSNHDNEQKFLQSGKTAPSSPLSSTQVRPQGSSSPP